MHIPRNKVIVVTGDPRSGTSLMMQTLHLLGVRVSGEKFPMRPASERRLERLPDEQQSELQARWEQAQQLNPKGFFEVPGVVMRGLRSTERHGGSAVKIVSPGAWPRQTPRGVVGTPPELVHKAILCLRDPRHVAESQRNLQTGVAVAGVVGWDGPRFNASPTRYLLENGGLAEWLSRQDDALRSRWLVVDYDEFVENPAATVRDLSEFLAYQPTRLQVFEAWDNVDPRLRRSPGEFTAWPADVADDGRLAEELYGAFKTFDPVELAAVAAQIDTRRELARLERARWYDRDFGVLASPELARQLNRSLPLRRRLKELYRKELRAGLHPQVDATFEELGDAPSYPVARPPDLGELSRPYVRYAGELLSWEAAYARHRQRRARLEVSIDPEKLNRELQRAR